MEAISQELIDKLFICMELFYGDRWTKYHSKKHSEAMAKTVWINGLYGLNYEQIKHALLICKRHSQSLTVNPPHLMEFFRYAKGESIPYINHPNTYEKGNLEIAKKHLEEIKIKTRGYINLDLQKRLFL
jgi:hypothetical protein